MGDRASISFSKNGHTSVTLCSHWGGRTFQDEAKKFAVELKTEGREAKKMRTPLDRLEPDTVIVDFIRHLTKDMERVESDLYLAAAPDEVDNSDNGHVDVEL